MNDVDYEIDLDTLEHMLDDPDDIYLHIIGKVQHWLDRLGVKIPRALCGVLLKRDPDKPEEGPTSPLCPRCVAINGSSNGKYLPPHD